VTLTRSLRVAGVCDRTAYYSALVGGQFFHTFVCKTRFASIFQHGIFNNTMMLYG
jgi:hypothetical protein